MGQEGHGCQVSIVGNREVAETILTDTVSEIHGR